jgi:hypothetical protein
MLRKESVCCFTIGLLAIASSALAQGTFSQQPAQGGPMVPLTCGDFQRNPNGSWSPLHPVTVNGVTMGGPGVAFTEGVSFGGVDLAATLNKQCR